ncbi:MAG: GTPase ObgE [Candidatus Wallbacteria bacterium]
MFIDEVKIFIKAGDGGKGSVSFRKEKYVPKGGPDGGDGGAGGNVIFIASDDLHTLLDFKHKKIYKADDGQNGLGSKMFGKKGEDILIKVPVGTQVFDATSGKLLCDLDKLGSEYTAAQGGSGGRGNAKFTSPTRHAPKYAELGGIGEEKEVRLVLKLIADIGLVGFPNAGKSTILSKISHATPKIADYPFTTLAPNLGVAQIGFNKTIVVADIPGLIEGAHTGVGLGNKFLKHIERTLGVAFIIDMTGFERNDPLNDLKVLYKELKSFSKKLVEKPFIIAANKMDIPDSKENLESFKKKLKKLKTFAKAKIIEISGLTGLHLDNFLKQLYKLKLDAIEHAQTEKADFPTGGTMEIQAHTTENDIESLGNRMGAGKTIATQRRRKPSVTIQKNPDNSYSIICPEFERAVSVINFRTEDAIYYFRKTLKKFEIDKALRKAGAQEGDSIFVQDFEFEYQPE